MFFPEVNRISSKLAMQENHMSLNIFPTLTLIELLAAVFAPKHVFLVFIFFGIRSHA